MELLIALAGFAGGWFLVAGPIFQAAVELREHEAAGKRYLLDQPDDASRKVSPWWWLLPPVKIFLEKRRSDRYRQEYFSQLPADDAALLVSFMNKATGWVYVATGAFLIAVKETFELVEELHLEVWVFWVAIVVMFLIAVLNTVIRVQRGTLMAKLR